MRHTPPDRRPTKRQGASPRAPNRDAVTQREQGTPHAAPHWRSRERTPGHPATPVSRPALALPALALVCATLAACGASTTTVTVKSTPPDTSSTSTRTSTTSTTATAPPTSTQSTTTASSSTGETHTAPEPAFAEGQNKATPESAAAEVLKAHGYAPVDAAQYHPKQTLAVLIGTHTESGVADEQAFFFLDGRYIGTDAKEASASVQLVSQDETEVTLSYALYRPSDPTSSPSGGSAVVHFQLDDGRLQAVGQIPPARSASGLSRR